MKTKRTVTCESIYKRGMREPRRGELNHELKRIIFGYCTKKPFKEAVKSVELAVARLAARFGVVSYECSYDRNVDKRSSKPWINEFLSVRAYRRRSNGTLAIHRVGASSHPHFFSKNGDRYANLSATRDIHVFYGIDDPYDWHYHCIRKPSGTLIAKWKRDQRKFKA